MRRTHLMAISMAGAGALILTACGGSGGPQSGGSGGLSNDKVVIGVINDQSGVYKDASGPNSGAAVQMAIDDYKAKHGDQGVAKSIELIQADHQNKADIANTKSQEMYDRQNADIILDVPNSAAALAIANQAQAKKKLYINISAGTTALIGDKCNKYTFHYAYNTAMLAKVSASTIVKGGGSRWNIVYPDYAFGQDMNKSFSNEVQQAGGSVGQSIATPFPSDNFATFITKAGEGNPQVVASMHAGGDLINFVKQYNQSSIKDSTQLAVGLMFITDIHSLGLDQFAGTKFAETWYWNADAENRQWADKFMAKTGTRPTFAHAANYSAATQYLEAVQAKGTDNPDEIIKDLEGKKINDAYLRNGEIRAADHAVVHDAYLAQVKTKDESSEPWDVEKILETVPANEAYAAPNPACRING